MTSSFKRFGLSIGAAAIAAITIAGAGIHVAAQDTSPATGRRGGPGGPGPGGFGRGGPGRFGGPGGPMGRGGVVGMPLERLGLTDAQREQVRTIVQGHDAELSALRERADAAREALQTVMMADAVNEGAIRASSATVAAVEADINVVQARIRSEVFAQLTP